MNNNYYVYIMTSEFNTVLYVGVTNDLVRRIYEHKNKLVKGFTGKYRVIKLVYYEMTDDINSAIEREKNIKKWSRSKKAALVNSMNKDWRDLYDELMK
jgi:putative endonuclease